MLCLNGTWEFASAEGAWQACRVPGVTLDPAQAQALRLHRKVRLPVQPFTRLLLVLKGARFSPQVYVNGEQVSQAEGGMAVTRHLFSHPDCVPGAEIDLEIRLCGLDELPETDASRIPEADRWRSNLSSCLWDDVLLFPVGNAAITRIVPRAENGGVRVLLDVDAAAPCPLEVQLLDADGECISRIQTMAEGARTEVFLPATLKAWSPETPVLYRIQATVSDGSISSQQTVPFGRSLFQVEGHGFLLNGEPVHLRGTSVVWHRFCRDPEGRILAFDQNWFEQNIVLRLKKAGANLLRFHLGAPMESLLTLCDRHGLCVQLEWIFFHSMKASEESLISQWRELMTLASQHPSVCIIQLWNETEGPELATAYRALSALENEFPHTVISHRDVVHVHKYWWSLFENLNLSYNDASELPGAAMVDEFGGNYLDGALNVGAYPEAAEAFERFLGNGHTAEERHELQALATARVGEYWRRIGAAGCATFCALSSPEDGNHHFLGALANGTPKKVWQACSAVYAPRAVSLAMWDRAFEPGQRVMAKVCLINDTGHQADMRWHTAVVDEAGHAWRSPVQTHTVPAHTRLWAQAELQLPESGDRAVLEARLEESPYPVSSWPVRLHRISCPEELKGLAFTMLSDEPELRAFALAHGMVEAEHNAKLLIGGEKALERMQRDEAYRASLERRIASGAGMVLAQIGPCLLGEGYFNDPAQIRLDGDTPLKHRQSWRYRLPFERTLRFDAQAEAESCCHPANGKESFDGLQRGALQLGNGYRGGLTAPAVSMELEPTDHRGLLEQWVRRGADRDMLLQQPGCVAYELEDFYSFAPEPSEQAAAALRERVRFLVADAPSLEKRIDPEADMETIQLGQLLEAAKGRKPAEQPETLVVCGRGLKRAAAYAWRETETGGTVVLSQLLTKGRLVKDFSQPGIYGARYDPEMAQMMLLLFRRAVG